MVNVMWETTSMKQGSSIQSYPIIIIHFMLVAHRIALMNCCFTSGHLRTEVAHSRTVSALSILKKLIDSEQYG